MSQALSIAKPAPWARFGAVALAESPSKITLPSLVAHENFVIPYIFLMSVLRIIDGSEISISFLMSIFPFQCENWLSNHSLVSDVNVWLPLNFYNP
jgi:hypothetical protein